MTQRREVSKYAYGYSRPKPSQLVPKSQAPSDLNVVEDQSFNLARTITIRCKYALDLTEVHRVYYVGVH